MYECVCVWALLTVEKWLEVRVDICALLRDVEVTGELVRELPTRLDDGALGTQRVANNTFVTHLPLYCRHTHGHCCAPSRDIPS